MKKQRTFRYTVLQLFVGLLLVLGASIILNSYFQTSRVVQRLSARINREVVEKVERKTLEYLLTPVAMTKITAFVVGSMPDIIANHEYLWRFMWQPLLMTQQLESFFVGDQHGNYVQVRRAPRLATRRIERNGGE